MNKLIVWGTASFLLLAACAPSAGTVNDHAAIPKRLLSFPKAQYQYVADVNGQLIAFTLPGSLTVKDSYAYENDQQLSPFNPGPDLLCTAYLRYYVMGHVLPDGRLGLLKDCGSAAPRSVRSMYAYDWRAQQLTRLMTASFWTPSGGAFTWNPRMTRGVQEMGGGWTGTIFWIDADGPSPMEVEVEDRGLTWNLRDYYEGKRKGIGMAENPAWSPDGRTIAFFASTYGIRETPVPGVYMQSELYFMDPSTLRPVQMLKAIVSDGYLRWSPDSRRLVFFGCIGWQAECGLWLFDIAGKTLTLVDGGDYFDDVTWMGNTKLAAIRDVTLPGDANQIWEYSLPASVAP